MFLLRHGQSYFNLHFNLTRLDPGIEDPELTPLGMQQAAAAAEKLADAPLTRIIVSPYTRALQTAQPFLESHDAPVDIMHEVRERAAFVCDVGSTPESLAARFPHHDFGHLPRRWWHPGIEPAGGNDRARERISHLDRRTRGQRDDARDQSLGFHPGAFGQLGRNGEILEYDPAQRPPEGVQPR